MEAYEINREEIQGMKPTATGYKVIAWDSGTQNSYKYGNVGETLTGKIFKVDGEIMPCNWGLHFCKSPADVFNFYNALTYNRYFKVNAYGEVLDHEENKSVTNILEFAEEYDFKQFIEIIKRIHIAMVSVRAMVSASAKHLKTVYFVPE